jgi:hypothetical protein
MFGCGGGGGDGSGGLAIAGGSGGSGTVAIKYPLSRYRLFSDPNVIEYWDSNMINMGSGSVLLAWTGSKAGYVLSASSAATAPWAYHDSLTCRHGIQFNGTSVLSTPHLNDIIDGLDKITIIWCAVDNTTAGGYLIQADVGSANSWGIYVNDAGRTLEGISYGSPASTLALKYSTTETQSAAGIRTFTFDANQADGGQRYRLNGVDVSLLTLFQTITTGQNYTFRKPSAMVVAPPATTTLHSLCIVRGIPSDDELLRIEREMGRLISLYNL